MSRTVSMMCVAWPPCRSDAAGNAPAMHSVASARMISPTTATAFASEYLACASHMADTAPWCISKRPAQHTRRGAKEQGCRLNEHAAREQRRGWFFYAIGDGRAPEGHLDRQQADMLHTESGKSRKTDPRRETRNPRKRQQINSRHRNQEGRPKFRNRII
jgi:hypothetical protein